MAVLSLPVKQPFKLVREFLEQQVESVSPATELSSAHEELEELVEGYG